MVRRTISLDPFCDRMVNIAYSMLVNVAAYKRPNYSLALNALLMGFYYDHAERDSAIHENTIRAVMDYLNGKRPRFEEIEKFEKWIQEIKNHPITRKHIAR